MGYDVARFQGDVDEDLICPICSGVLEEPVQAPHCEHAFCNACITQWFSQQQTCPVDRSVAPHCEHAFCNACITQWFSQQQTCPVDRSVAPHCEHAFCNACITQWFSQQQTCPVDRSVAPHCEHAFCNACITQWFSQQQTCPVDRSVVTVAHLRPVPRIMRNMLSKLQITCDNAVFGCTAVVRLDNLMAHLNDCEHNPKRPVTCEQGCGLEMPKDELPNHNCIKHLRSVVQQQQLRIADLEKTSAEHKHQLAEQKRDIQLLKAYMRAIRSVNPNLQNLEETIEYNEILEWVNSLQPARVTRWGGMISTPDAVLQAVIKRSLVESGCPASITNELIENAHERNWPQGLATLETRQMNRRYYENYVAKRIPGKQAVVVMACENQHMGEDMVLEPGLVMIFAHGVEEI